MPRNTWPAGTHAVPLRCAEPGCGAMSTTQAGSAPFYKNADGSPPVQTIITAMMPGDWIATVEWKQDPYMGVPIPVTRSYCGEHAPESHADRDGFPGQHGR